MPTFEPKALSKLASTELDGSDWYLPTLPELFILAQCSGTELTETLCSLTVQNAEHDLA